MADTWRRPARRDDLEASSSILSGAGPGGPPRHSSQARSEAAGLDDAERKAELDGPPVMGQEAHAMAVDPVPDEVLLRDGTQLLVRPIGPADASALVALHARLSVDTIYRRYFGARPHLSPADVDRFTRVDGRTRFALVALRGSDLVAVARYEGHPGERSAELAVVVDDALHRLGVGRLMLERLVDIAREAGLVELAADVLAGNAAMLSLLRSLGLPRRTVSDGETVTVLIDLSSGEPDSGRRARAEQHLARAGSMTPPP